MTKYGIYRTRTALDLCFWVALDYVIIMIKYNHRIILYS
jgi:hypothetical protein